jgi:hypothetical protein
MKSVSMTMVAVFALCSYRSESSECFRRAAADGGQLQIIGKDGKVTGFARSNTPVSKPKSAALWRI